MCLLAFALGADPRYRLVLAANRDERHARPSLPAAWWPELPALFGGRDAAAGGTWLAVDKSGRLAAVTNFRDPDARPAARSRGRLVTEFLAGGASIDGFLESLHGAHEDYGPFSLVLLDGPEARYYSNRAPGARLAPGVHALSNAALGDDWPKTAAARSGLAQWLRAGRPLEALFDLLADRGPPLPFPARYRSGLFLEGDEYGTRSSTVVAIDADDRLTFIERSFGARGAPLGEVRQTIALSRGIVPFSIAGARG
jgi:uncharacterized protein with NRDE domain